MKLSTKPYKDITKLEKDVVIVMLEKVRPSYIDNREIHHKQLNVQSLYMYEDQKNITYTGIILQTIIYQQQTIITASLSSVVVLEEYRENGIGKLIVDEATKWIQSQSIDLEIFTCHPSLVDFYTHGDVGKLSIILY